MQEGNTPGGPPDTHTPPPLPPRQKARPFLTLLSIALLITVAVMQRPAAPNPDKAADAAVGAVVQPPKVSPLVAIGKGLLWFKEEYAQPVPPDWIERVDDSAQTAADRFRAALLIGELVGPAERDTRFEKLDQKIAPDSPLRKDMETIAQADKARAGEGPPPDEAARNGLLERHGWFARMALAKDDPASAAAFKEELDRDGIALFAILALFGLVITGALIAGVILFIVGVVLLAGGRLRPRYTPIGPTERTDRGLWLETFAVFLVGFLVVHAVGAGLDSLAGPGAGWPVLATLLMQWCLVAVVFWPRLRGMSAEQFHAELGWHRGRGVFREIGAGILGYLAGLPIYVFVAILVTIAMFMQQAFRSMGSGSGGGPPEDMPLPDNKALDLLSGSGLPTLIVLGTLIVVWAPIVEESIFRGALFRHIRDRLGVPLAILLVAGAFALAHSYILAGLVMVGTLGALFAVMREWRGSLIAPMTAHCLHNGTVLLLLLTLLPFARG